MKLYHSTDTKNIGNIKAKGLKSISYWTPNLALAEYYAEDIADNGGSPVFLTVDLNLLNPLSLEPDYPGLEEPICTVIDMTENEVVAQWGSADGTWQNCLDIISSVRYTAPLPAYLLSLDGEAAILPLPDNHQQETQKIIDDLELRFGSDEALGVYIKPDKGSKISIQEYKTLPDDAKEAAQGYSCFPDGSYAVECTNFAVQIYRAMPDRTTIWGFSSEDNPTSGILESSGCDGHDFAVVDGRFVVDPWVRLVAGESEQIVFDFYCDQDRSKILEMYGPRRCWSNLQSIERRIQAEAPTEVFWIGMRA